MGSTGVKSGTGIPGGVEVLVDGATVGGGGIEFDVVDALVLLTLGGGGVGGGGGVVFWFSLFFKYNLLNRCWSSEA